jgi:hypothetical protein
MEKKKLTHTQILYNFFRKGGKLADHMCYLELGFCNLRSRIVNIERDYNVKVKRERAKGKRYLIYSL